VENEDPPLATSSRDLARPEDLAAADAFFARADLAEGSEEDAGALVRAALSRSAPPEEEPGQPGDHPVSWWPWLLIFVVTSGGATWQGVGLRRRRHGPGFPPVEEV
jgi:hypothetical protein